MKCICGHGVAVHVRSGCLGMVERVGQARNKWRCKCALQFDAQSIVTEQPAYDIVGAK